MAQYGYMYTSASSYNTIREESRGPAIKPFVPFVPNSNYDPSTNSDGYATKKKIVSVASRLPYDDYDDDYKKRSSPTSGEWNHRQRSPDHVAQRKVDDFLTKVQNEASRPQWNSLPTNDWRHSPQATSYNGPAFSYANANGSDYVGNKDVRKPIASTIRDDGYSGPNGYGGYGNHNNKEGHRPSSSPNRNDKYSGYGDYDNNEGHRSIKSPKYGGYNGGNAYGDYGNHNKEELKPIRGNEGYGAPNSGYGSYNNREEQRPFGSSPKSVNYGGNGYGDYAGDYTNKDRHKPISVSWTHPPRKGTQLSEPTNNMDKALELLKEAARVSSNDLSNKGGHKAASPTALPYENRDDYLLRHGGADKSASSNSWAAGLGKAPKSKFDKSMELVKEAEKLKSIVTAPSVDKRDLTNQFANLNISSKPKTPPKHSTFIGREVDYNRRDYGNAPIINSRTAEEIYGGRRI